MFLEFLCFLQDQLVQRQLGYGSLQPIILPLELFPTLGLINLQPTVLTRPLVVGLLRDPDAQADLAGPLALTQSNLRLAQKSDDLLRRLAFPC